MADPIPQSHCPLCFGQRLKTVKNQFYPTHLYWNCRECDLIFLAPECHLSVEAEKKRYESHQNSSTDEGYVQFLSPMLCLISNYFSSFSPLSEVEGLDFGCGPQPVLLELLREQGFKMTGYDPFFRAENEALCRQYDFVVSTEVFEHFSKPREDIERITSLFKPQSVLFVMTQFHQGPEHFQSWWYTRDQTHVSFYSANTWGWIQSFFSLTSASHDGKSLIQLKK